MNEQQLIVLSGLMNVLRDLSFEELKKVENFIIFNLENEK